ncbi:hypothetical protein Goshw_026648 [Gossypium schwendimanii]|uniref:RNase H type-1 domain-containing protein n=1 Tax=Gossypium schwendimanii TaxID=34291 RepID=A0A7J9LI98_GOSSC|nr:hypothetical protein [Gossypium schwendimanii]
MGIIVRNKKSLIMAACTYPWENISDLVMAEVRACLQAIIMAEDNGVLRHMHRRGYANHNM